MAGARRHEFCRINARATTAVRGGGHLAESNATGAETGKDGNAAGNADYVTKAEFEALNTSLATIATTLKGLPNMVNKAAQDHAGRQLKALGLTPEVLAKITAPPKTEGEGEGGDDADAEPPKPAKGKGGKQPEALWVALTHFLTPFKDTRHAPT
jgi:hypothetical protein